MFDLNLFEWFSCNKTKRGNFFSIHPENEKDFKKEVVRSGGLTLYIYNENETLIKERQVRNKGKEWKSKVFTYLKTVTIDGKKIESDDGFFNSQIYAIPKNYNPIP